MELSIIIVNWNSKDFLGKCLASIPAQAGISEYEIVVIDSASFDGCDRMLREHFPEVRFIQSDENLGFARANNAAFGASSGRHVLFLNPDTEVVGAAIQEMLKRLDTLPNAGSVGCRLLNTDGTVQTSCIQSIPTILNQFLDSEFLRSLLPDSRLWGTSALNQADPIPSAVEGISGACVMLKRAVFEKVGQFSHDYFMYAEDMDLSYKVMQAGYLNYYVPGASVVHHGGGSSSSAASQFSAVMMRESLRLFFHKTRGRTYAGLYRASVFVSALLRLTLLLCLSPLHFIRGRFSDWKGVAGKWLAVMRWSISTPKWVRKYSGIELTSSPSLLPVQGSQI